MKLKNYLAMMAIALCAVACSDDDNKKEDTVIPAQEVAGIYNGTLSLSVSGNDQGTSDSQVKITAEEGGTVQVLLVGGAGEGMMSLPDIAIPGIKVQTSDNVTYTFPESSELLHHFFRCKVSYITMSYHLFRRKLLKRIPDKRVARLGGKTFVPVVLAYYPTYFKCAYINRFKTDTADDTAVMQHYIFSDGRLFLRPLTNRVSDKSYGLLNSIIRQKEHHIDFFIAGILVNFVCIRNVYRSYNKSFGHDRVFFYIIQQLHTFTKQNRNRMRVSEKSLKCIKSVVNVNIRYCSRFPIIVNFNAIIIITVFHFIHSL